MHRLLIPLLLVPLGAVAQPASTPTPPGRGAPPSPLERGPFNPPVTGQESYQNKESPAERQQAIEREKKVWEDTCKTKKFVIANAFDQPDIINQLRNAKTDAEKKEVEDRARHRMERQKRAYEGICASIEGK